MANMIENAKNSVNALLAAACEKAVEKGQLPAGAVLSGTVEIPKDTANGDYAANHAMTGARALRMAPRKIMRLMMPPSRSTTTLSGMTITLVRVPSMPVTSDSR